MSKITRNKSRKYNKSHAITNIKPNTRHNKSNVKFSEEEYIYQNINLPNGKILEDTYTHTNYNGKHTRKHRRRIIPLPKNNIPLLQSNLSKQSTNPLFSLFHSPYSYTNTTLRPILRIDNRMPTPFLIIRPHNNIQLKHNTKYSRKDHKHKQ